MERSDAILSDLEGNLLCARCGRAYGRSALKLLGGRADRQFVRCSCEKCHTDAIVIVILREMVAEKAAAEEPRFTRDDILDAAELMSPAKVTLAQLGLA